MYIRFQVYLIFALHMKPLIGLFLFLVLLTSCNDVAVSDREVQAVQSVLDFYGGVVNRSKGFSYENGQKQTYFKLAISESELLEAYKDFIELPASNIAYLFYKNLEAEQGNYTHVQVEITSLAGEVVEYEYAAEDLLEVDRFLPIMKQVSHHFETEDMNGLLAQFDPSLPYEELIAYTHPYDSAFGRVQDIQFQGFSFYEVEGKGDTPRPMIHLGGIMQREKENTPLSLFIDRRSQVILSMNFNF